MLPHIGGGLLARLPDRGQLLLQCNGRKEENVLMRARCHDASPWPWPRRRGAPTICADSTQIGFSSPTPTNPIVDRAVAAVRSRRRGTRSARLACDGERWRGGRSESRILFSAQKRSLSQTMFDPTSKDSEATTAWRMLGWYGLGSTIPFKNFSPSPLGCRIFRLFTYGVANRSISLTLQFLLPYFFVSFCHFAQTWIAPCIIINCTMLHT